MRIFKIFCKENETEEKHIKKPPDYRYLQLLRINLLILNAWPGKHIGEKESKFAVIITMTNIFLKVFYFLDGAFYLRNHFNTLSFYEKGHTILVLIMSFVALTRIFTISLSKRCREVVVRYLTKMHLLYFRHSSDYAEKIHKQVHSICHWYTLWFIFQFWIGVTFFTLSPVYRNYREGNYKQNNEQTNKTYQHAIYLELPFDYTNNFNGYLFVFFLNALDTYVCSAWLVMLDLLLSVLVFHLWGHYKILLNDLGSFKLPAKKEVIIINDEKVYVEKYSNDELREVSEKLKRCIDYHRLITDFTNEISQAYGPMLFIYYAFHQICGCLLLLGCSQMTTEALMTYGVLTAVSFEQLIQLSVIFELIGSTGDKLKHAVYGVPWEYMDIKNLKTVAIFLINVQKPVNVKALGLASVGVTTMATIIKTSLTYFTILQSIGNEI